MISFMDLTREYEFLKLELNESLQETLSSGYYIMGPALKEFEKNLSRYIGTRYASGVNSGSDALFLALKSLGIGKNDEVITVAHTFISTADAIVLNGAHPVWVDIEPDSYLIDPERVVEKITPHTRALLVVHLYGQPAEMDKLNEICQEHDLYLIEDASQAHGAKYKGSKVGSLGDVSCFSFYPTKNLGGYGDGGMVLTKHREVQEKIRNLRDYGQQKKNLHTKIGINSRLDEIQATILSLKLKYLDSWNKKRRKLARIYHDQLTPRVRTPQEKENRKHVYHLYVINAPQRDLIQRELFKNGIESRIHYPTPVHKQPAYLPWRDSYLPCTDQVSKGILSLPLYPWLEEEEVNRICEVIDHASM